jgi:outer membrane protein OmpA-like peptidoglycan-associated protein
MKSRLIALFPSLVTVFLSVACTHTGSEESIDPTSTVENAVQDSDSETHALQSKTDDPSTEVDKEIAKEAKPLIENVSIIFENKSTKLPASSDALLKEVADHMNSDVSLKLRLDAYSLRKGKAAQKKQLATESLTNVKNKLVKLGVDPKRIKVSTYRKDQIDQDRKIDVIFE